MSKQKNETCPELLIFIYILGSVSLTAYLQSSVSQQRDSVVQPKIHTLGILQVGYVTEEDVKTLSKSQKAFIDQIIDGGPRAAGELIR